MSEPTRTCWYVPGENRRRDCACDDCIAFTRAYDAHFKEISAPLEAAINESAPAMLQHNLLGGKMTVEEIETPIGFTVPDAPITEAELVVRYAKWVLDICGGNKTHAARALGIDRRSLYRRLGGCPCDQKEK